MVLDEIEEEIVRLASSDRCQSPRCFGPVPLEWIDEAERESGMTFPPSYRAFIRVYGCGTLFHYEFSGTPNRRELTPTRRPFSHVVDHTNWYRNPPYSWPHARVAFAINGKGDQTYYLDTARRDDRSECPVFVDRPDHAVQMVATDFLDFLRKLANRETLLRFATSRAELRAVNEIRT